MNSRIFTLLVSLRIAAFVLFAGTASAQSGADCVPLAEQYPELGTSQSISANREFITVWASFELPGGPCGYESAAAHYNALLEDAQSRGGPTQHTRMSLPDWDGHWGTDYNTGEFAVRGIRSTVEGLAARLTPEAREQFIEDRRMMEAGQGFDPLSLCLPPNFPRWFSEPSLREHFLKPNKSLLGNEFMNQFRRIFTDGRPHPSDEWLSNEWLGYSIGFWDNDVLTIWTKGLKEGILQRNMPRQSNELEVIERWRKVDPESPVHDDIEPNTFGADYVPNERIEIEVTMYDRNFAQPWHTVVAYYKEDDRTPADKEIVWPQHDDCIEGSNWFISDDGIISQYAPGEKPPVADPDYWFSDDYSTF